MFSAIFEGDVPLKEEWGIISILTRPCSRHRESWCNRWLKRINDRNLWKFLAHSRCMINTSRSTSGFQSILVKRLQRLVSFCHLSFLLAFILDSAVNPTFHQHCSLLISSDQLVAKVSGYSQFLFCLNSLRILTLLMSLFSTNFFLPLGSLTSRSPGFSLFYL